MLDFMFGIFIRLVIFFAISLASGLLFNIIKRWKDHNSIYYAICGMFSFISYLISDNYSTFLGVLTYAFFLWSIIIFLKRDKNRHS